MTPELFNDLVRAFRLQPGVYGAAARICGCCHKTAKKAWHDGWPDKDFKPVKVLLESEEHYVRAQAELDGEELTLERRAELIAQNEAVVNGHLELEASKVHAVKTKSEELRMIGLARATITSNLQSMNSMAEASELLATRLASAIRDFAMDESEPLVFGTKEYGQAHRAFRGIAMAARDITTAVKTTLEAERLHLGEPTEIIGHKAMDDMSIEELMQEIEHADSAVENAKRRGIMAIDGGKKSPA